MSGRQVHHTACPIAGQATPIHPALPGEIHHSGNGSGSGRRQQVGQPLRIDNPIHDDLVTMEAARNQQRVDTGALRCREISPDGVADCQDMRTIDRSAGQCSGAFES
jgi:hypothetical protein